MEARVHNWLVQKSLRKKYLTIGKKTHPWEHLSYLVCLRPIKRGRSSGGVLQSLQSCRTGFLLWWKHRFGKMSNDNVEVSSKCKKRLEWEKICEVFIYIFSWLRNGKSGTLRSVWRGWSVRILAPTLFWGSSPTGQCSSWTWVKISPFTSSQLEWWRSRQNTSGHLPRYRQLTSRKSWRAFVPSISEMKMVCRWWANQRKRRPKFKNWWKGRLVFVQRFFVKSQYRERFSFSWPRKFECDGTFVVIERQ